MKKTGTMSGAAPFAMAAALVWSAPVLAQDNQPEDEQDEDRIILGGGAREPIIVSAARDEGVGLTSYTGSVTLLDARRIEQRQIRNIEDALRDVPSLAVGSIAGQTQIRLRGTEANHVLVLVDGIEVSDPGSGEYDIGTLQAEIGSRVEVLRGPQSAIWGNDAIGGVVAYQSASGADRKGFSTFLEGGTNNTINGSARFGAAGNGWDAALSATLVSTDGEPNTRAEGGGERDIGRDSYTISGRGSAKVTSNLTLRAVGRYVLTEGDFNEQDFGFGSSTLGLFIDSPATRFEQEAVSGLVGARLEALEGSLTHDLSAQFTDAERSTVQPTGFPSATQSDRFKVSSVTAYDFGRSDHLLTFAADFELEGFNNVLTFDDRNEVENVGFVGQYRYNGGRFDFSASLRHDVNDLFRDATTFRVGAGLYVTDTTRLRAAVGTGVKNPTLTELFGFFDGQFIGNPELEPEESISWEIGIDQTLLGDRVTLSATFFSAELESEIFTTFPPPTFIATPGNRMTDSEQQGVELEIFADLGSGFSFNGAYSFLDAEEDGVEEVRRPDHLASAVLNWRAPRDAASVNLAVRYNGEALDSDFTTGAFPAPTATLEAYTLVNLNARVKLADGLNLFGRIENLLDESYEPVFTFVAPGIQVLGGFEATF